MQPTSQSLRPETLKEATSNMDRLTQLQDALDQMARLFSLSVNYLSQREHTILLSANVVQILIVQRHSSVFFFLLRQAHVQDPAEFKKVQHDLVTDICRKAKQVEILIDNLPGATRTEEEQLESISQLEKELQEANENYRKAVQTAESLLEQITEAIDVIANDQTLPIHCETIDQAASTAL
ncbi:6371_t:CDS:2 [Paraglomus occultum]|uniref:Mediator of RNA polymerase II transcription subunit 21 n=1 Tax=Paraglomus occultum TaxID=144539 RepID=A0A9N8Z2Y2_9GLOM|nr:6371_t:CDS:2 [Paraglomus occultum]